MAAHDEKDRGKLERLQSQKAQAVSIAIDDAIRALAQHANGREFLWYLLQIGRVGTQPFTSNALTTAFQCGELNVGNTILARITAVDPAIYVRMQQEQQSNYDRLVNANVADNSAEQPAGDYDPSSRPGSYDHPDA